MTRSELQVNISWLKDMISVMESSDRYSFRQDGMLIEYDKCKELLVEYERKLKQM